MAESQEPSYVAGQLIIKLRPEAGAEIEEALKEKKAPAATGLAWFDLLNKRYDVSAISPIFSNQPGVEEISRKYPARSLRAQAGTQLPSLRYIYKLTLRSDVDILKAAADYSAHPEVEYAEPNYIATIQRNSLKLQ